ncbi:MAG: nucleotidyltransferase domain-containing protein, partial [Candidatus Woesearchaeota archaeon]|nr:nucleotidyltransferase domain-containing protein [Candidatus Woesearchaeota archaeon]
MDFRIEKKPQLNIDRYNREEVDIAYKFAKFAYKEFGSFVKAIVLFGSASRKEDVPEGDIDILILVDDLSISINPEVAETYRIIVQKLVRDISMRLHITTLKLTSFWEYVKMGDPVAINILRDGTSLLDTGFFDPLQVLLKQGRIRPTSEAVWNYFVRAPATLLNSKWHIIQ